ncbi:MAG: alkaline phosphatase family protein [Myxococcaceae bacterium]
MHRILAGLVFVASIASAAAPERPRLGVLIVIDQLSAYSFDARIANTKAGLATMARDGHRIEELRYQYAPTVTSAGHTTLATGAWPATHGIVANTWWDEGDAMEVHSTEDAHYQVLGRPAVKGDCTAPTRMQAPTLGDAMHWNDSRSIVVGVAPKERSAMLMSGKSANAAVWIDSERPFFTTSTYYTKDLYPWVQPINDELAKMVAQALKPGLPQGGITGKNPELPVARDGGFGTINEELAWQPTFEKMEVDAALAAVKALGMGKDEVPDLLTLSFSSHDVYGHHFGPESQESLDCFNRIDGELGRLFAQLDLLVGKGKWVAALSADHGAGKLAEDLVARHIDAGRFDGKALKGKLEAEADTALGQGDWFVGYWTPGVFARPPVRAKLHTIDERLRAVAKQQAGVEDLLPLPRLLSGESFGPLGEIFHRAAYAGRSPDFIVVTRPYWQYGVLDRVAHGTPYLYDRAVPALFYGAGVKKGATPYADAVDVAPTLAKLLGVPPPAAAEGRAISSVR